MTRNVLIGATAGVIVILGISTVLASHDFEENQAEQSTYQRSQDCKYPPCD